MAGKVLKGVPGLNRMLNDLPKEVQKRIRDESQEIALDAAREARARASAAIGGVVAVARYVAPNITAPRDRVPVIKMDGSKPLPPRNGVPRTGPGQTVGDVMWASEYGSNQSKQFSPWGGTGDSAGYFLWPSIRMDEMVERWGDAVEDAMKAAH
jgi:hypothetical protein